MTLNVSVQWDHGNPVSLHTEHVDSIDVLCVVQVPLVVFGPQIRFVCNDFTCDNFACLDDSKFFLRWVLL